MRANGWAARGLGLLLGCGLDALAADPRRGHPVAAFGKAAAALEEHSYADDHLAGATHAAACLAPLLVIGWLAERATRGHPVAHTILTAATTWAVLGGTTLQREGAAMAELLEANDLAGARQRITHLCGRDPDQLDHPQLARAAVESMAENASDAAVGSLLWGATCGIPGMLLHRGANTLDAMIGHRNERYRRFGTVVARLDDLMNLLPARVTGLLAVALAPTVGGDRAEAWPVLARDHANHPSPNGGWCEAGWAGALRIQLGGRNHYYGGRVEDRGLLGDGPAPGTGEVRRAARLVGAVTAAAAIASLVITWLLGKAQP